VNKDSEGRMHFKIVFWGPTLSGKTTALRWIYDNIEGLAKGGFTSVEDPTGRTLYFDYTPLSASGKVIFDCFTVAGQKRHRHQRRIVIQGTDGIIFVADSLTSQLNENTESLNELKQMLGTNLNSDIPVVVMLNKRDEPGAAERKALIDSLGLKDVAVFETIATKGTGVRRAFQAIAREVLLKRLYKGSLPTV
jgi:signal recognition particle receptor subunit beta